MGTQVGGGAAALPELGGPPKVPQKMVSNAFLIGDRPIGYGATLAGVGLWEQGGLGEGNIPHCQGSLPI